LVISQTGFIRFHWKLKEEGDGALFALNVAGGILAIGVSFTRVCWLSAIFLHEVYIEAITLKPLKIGAQMPIGTCHAVLVARGGRGVVRHTR
jgi:hypothetical protein